VDSIPVPRYNRPTLLPTALSGLLLLSQVIDKITTCLHERFLENNDLSLYRDVEAVLLSTDPPSENNKHLPIVEASSVSARLTDINCEALEMELSLIRIIHGHEHCPTWKT